MGEIIRGEQEQIVGIKMGVDRVSARKKRTSGYRVSNRAEIRTGGKWGAKEEGQRWQQEGRDGTCGVIGKRSGKEDTGGSDGEIWKRLRRWEVKCTWGG